MNTIDINTLSLPLEAGGTPCWKVELKVVTGGLSCCPYATGRKFPVGEKYPGVLSKHEKEA